MRVLVLNGPNLGRLGQRQPEIYGSTTIAEIETWCREAAGDRAVRFHQTNAEHQLVDWVHEAIDEGAGIVINPAGLSFRSIPLLDALKASLAIISTAAGRSTPNAAALARLAEAGVAVYRTDLHGTLTVTTDGTRFWLEPER